MRFTVEELCQGMIPPEKQRKNLEKLVEALNTLGSVYADPVVVIRGLRNEMQNEAVGGVPNSPHLTGEAVDLQDKDHKLSQFILNNLVMLERAGLYMENPYYCVSKTTGNNWIHLQIRKASQTVFKPY